MCIAILNKQGKLGCEQLENSWKNNNQGGGLMWVEQGKLQTFKTYDYTDFSDMYFNLRTNPNIGNIVLHFRIATSGYQNPINLHPFLVNENLGFVHNGILSGLGNKDYSDTYEFNEMLKKLPVDFLQNDSIVLFITEYISSSKLIFLDSQDNYSIINENFGDWDETGDNWYSNDSHKSYNDWVYFGNTKVTRQQPLTWEKPSVSKNEKKRKAKKHRKYVNDNFLNVTEFRLDWLEDLFECELWEDEFIEKLDMYYEATWESDLVKLTEHIQDDLVYQEEQKRKDVSEWGRVYDDYSTYKGVEYYDDKLYLI